MPERAVHVVVSGRVQGVWFRGWTKQQTAARNLRGWVRNRRDGTVEAVFAGNPEDIESMLAACRRGPPAAKVVDLRATPAPLPNDIGFSHLPTV
ncbi:MAG: acylphosphatase [Magnetovibrio sp.]|nr:acylphosphatase [Magnetovibrio sp.]